MIKRKIQYGKDGKWIHNYYFTNRNNPCGCDSNCYHLEYDLAEEDFHKEARCDFFRHR